MAFLCQKKKIIKGILNFSVACKKKTHECIDMRSGGTMVLAAYVHNSPMYYFASVTVQQETLRHCYWDVICGKASTVNISWWLQPCLPSFFHKKVLSLQYFGYCVTLLWRSNYSKQSEELKTGHLNELREKYTRKQENVFITFQASNWKNRDQYSRTSLSGVKKTIQHKTGRNHLLQNKQGN